MIDEAHFDLYMRWRALGGARRGISLSELLGMSTEMLIDFLWLQRRYARHLNNAMRLKNERR